MIFFYLYMFLFIKDASIHRVTIAASVAILEIKILMFGATGVKCSYIIYLVGIGNICVLIHYVLSSNLLDFILRSCLTALVYYP